MTCQGGCDETGKTCDYDDHKYDADIEMTQAEYDELCRTRDSDKAWLSAMWGHKVGRRFSESKTAELLGITKREAHQLGVDGKLLGLTSSTPGEFVYPSWQFDGNRIHAQVADMIAPFFEHDAIYPLMIAALVKDTKTEEGKTVVQALRDGDDMTQVITQLRSTATHWSR